VTAILCRPDIDILSIMGRHFHILPTATFLKISANSRPRTVGFYALFEMKERGWISDRPKYLSTLCVKEN
jgi:hypothetical protein